MLFDTIEELIDLANKQDKKISDIMIEQEMAVSNRTYEAIMAQMEENLVVMEEAVQKGIKGVSSYSGLTGNDAVKLNEYMLQGNPLTDQTSLKAVCYAIATNEVNSAMGIICATPTAGSAGVVPGVILAVSEKLMSHRQQVIESLFTAAAFGYVTANHAFISGAEGGCQAEIGSASGMAAAAVVELAGGTPNQSAMAFAIALKNMLGLACDPVAGLVEVPCVKRNAAGASNAMTAAEMALAGIESKIPADEVIDAMYAVGRSMHPDIRETGRGGLAGTPTGKRIAKELFGK